MKVDLIFEGGGVKGIAFIGAICCLEENGYRWESIAGTSAGSIVGSLLAAGFTGHELKNIMMDLDFNNFKDKTALQWIPLIGDAIHLFMSKGLYLGNVAEEFVRENLEKKGIETFQDLAERGKSKLKIIASDVTNREILILPDDLSKYGIDPMSFSIAKAVRMSMSIPIFYYPTLIKSKDYISYVVDGALYSNFPIWIFDVRGAPRWPTFGFRLVQNKKHNVSNKNLSFLGYATDIIEAALSKNELVYLRDKDSVRTMNIPTSNIKTTQFSITNEQKNWLFQSGYHSAKEFLKSWDFSQYIAKYRNSY